VPEFPLELGHGHVVHLVSWSPDRELNPQYAELPDVPVYGLIVDHISPSGVEHSGSIVFEGEVARKVAPGRDTWTLVSLDPLTVEPSLACSCGDHGFILGGAWVPA